MSCWPLYFNKVTFSSKDVRLLIDIESAKDVPIYVLYVLCILNCLSILLMFTFDLDNHFFFIFFSSLLIALIFNKTVTCKNIDRDLIKLFKLLRYVYTPFIAFHAVYLSYLWRLWSTKCDCSLDLQSYLNNIKLSMTRTSVY